MGVGGEFGIGMAIVTETWSKEMRAKATSVVARMAIWRISRFAPTSIYRSAFWMESCVLIWTHSALLAVYVRKSLSEPKIWEQKQRYKKNCYKKNLKVI